MLRTETTLPLEESLESIMKHQLALLRDLLSSLHQEQQFLSSDNPSALHELSDNRLQLLEAFERANASFESTSQMWIHACQDSDDSEKASTSLIERIELLRVHLKNSDVELILLCEQILRILEEIHRKATNIFNILEHKSPTEAAFNAHFKKLKPQTNLPATQLSLMEPDADFNPSN